MTSSVGTLSLVLLFACVALAEEQIECSAFDYPDLTLSLEACWAPPVQADGYIFHDEIKFWRRRLGAVVDFIHVQMLRHCDVLGQCNSKSLSNMLRIHHIESKVLEDFSQKLTDILDDEGTLDHYDAKCKAGLNDVFYNIVYDSDSGYTVMGKFDLHEVDYMVDMLYTRASGLQFDVKSNIQKYVKPSQKDEL